jgi:hypothetical protein
MLDSCAKGNLGYRFFLPRPKDLLILGTLPGIEKEALESHRPKLRRIGIDVVPDNGSVVAGCEF